MQFQITPAGFQDVVKMSMTGEVGEHFTEIREGSALELADRVARRCTEVCQERGVDMSEEIYDEVVADLAPHFRMP